MFRENEVTRSRGALLVAHDVIEAADGVQGLFRIGLDELCGIPGVGEARAARLKAAVELGRRTLFGDHDDRPAMRTTRDLVAYLQPRYAGFSVERFGVMLLDQKHRVIRSEILSTGTIDASISSPRDVFRVAILAQASFVVAFHNHPSGDATPSITDRLLTRRLHAAGELVGIALMDHIILGDREFYSFRAEGAV